MGRPLNKKFFGENQLKIRAFIPGGVGVVDAHIIAQKSSNTYIVTDGLETGRVRLTNKAENSFVAGDGAIVVDPFGAGPVEHASRVLAHVVKTFEGHEYTWNKNVAAAAAGQADLDFNWTPPSPPPPPPPPPGP